jgi:hypothetical protein
MPVGEIVTLGLLVTVHVAVPPAIGGSMLQPTVVELPRGTHTGVTLTVTVLMTGSCTSTVTLLSASPPGPAQIILYIVGDAGDTLSLPLTAPPVKKFADVGLQVVAFKAFHLKSVASPRITGLGCAKKVTLTGGGGGGATTAPMFTLIVPDALSPPRVTEAVAVFAPVLVYRHENRLLPFQEVRVPPVPHVGAA